MRRRPLTTRQRGVALIIVTVTIAILGGVVGDFAFNARVDLEAAANGRDQLRAEYLARSGIQLARLLIKVQQSVLDRNRQYVGDIQIGEFAPYLMKAFGGDTDERAGLGALLGIDVTSMKGLGVGKNATFDVAMTSDDGRLNVNCGGGISDAPHQQQLYSILSSLLWPPRYNRLFETPDPDGQYWTRDDVTRALLDWADLDETRFEPPPAAAGSNAEDYRYDTGRDPYRAHNNFYDTVEEVNLVRGVGDDFYGAFGDMLTVYGSCQINLGAINAEHWPLIAAIIRATVKDDHKQDPVLVDDVTLAALAQQVVTISQLTGGFGTVDQFISMINDPSSALTSATANSKDGSGGAAATTSKTGVVGVPLDPAKVNKVATVGPRRIYRLDASGTIQRTAAKKIQVHIRGIWDSAHTNQNTTSPDPNDRQGTWVYWRQD